MRFPEIPQGLITTLEKHFPDKCPRSDPGVFGLGMEAGRQEVIDLLRSHFNRQKDRSHVHGT